MLQVEQSGDPAGPLMDGPTDETLAKMKRVPTVPLIMRQIDRVNYILSTGGDASGAIQALYAVASSYLKTVNGWEETWEDRPCAGVQISGKWYAAPQPSDYASWYERIIDGLTQSGSIFEEITLSRVGPRKGRERIGRKLEVANPSLEANEPKRQGEIEAIAPGGDVGISALVDDNKNPGPNLDYA